jgi:CheY-like chemotaxis protein
LKSSQHVILVVEDDALLRLEAMDLIERAGFTAVEAPNSKEAIRILESRPDIHTVFTDIEMPPGIDGIMLAAAIRDRWPPIRIVVTSGQKIPRRGTLPVDALFLAKPYREQELVDAFRSLSD